MVTISISQAFCGFVGIELNQSAPNAMTLLKLRRLLEPHGLTQKIFETVNGHLTAQGLMMREGALVDATLIAAPPSSKNENEKRDSKMHRSGMGDDWHFGLKAHIGIDAASGLAHTVIGTDGDVSDVTQTHAHCCKAMTLRDTKALESTKKVLGRRRLGTLR